MQNTKAIDTFLATWRKASFTYYTDLYNEQRKLHNARWTLMEKYNYNAVSPNQVLNPDYVEAQDALKAFDKKQTKSDLYILSNVSYDYNQKRGTQFLDKVLDKEVKSKKVQFIARIEKKSGEIKDVNLTIGTDGSINGTVIGEEATVNVYSIIAGGYNIQKAHYRVLVKEVV
jgi:hypothetical protein